MKGTVVVFLFVLLAGSSFGQVDKKVESKITDVTVFLSRAQVSRVVKTRIEAGKTNIILTGLTSQLDQQSIQVSGKGNFIILGIVHQQNFLDEVNLPGPLRILKDSVEILQRQLIISQSQKEILNKEEQLLLSNQKIGGTSQNLTVTELKGMADFYRVRLGEIVTSRMKQDDLIKQLNKRLSNVQQQINEQHTLYAHNTSEIVVSVSADAPATVDLQVQYLVANASWQPVYDLRAINTKSPVQLNYKANVQQATGEDWKSVKLKLSTANPTLGGVKPELNAWYLSFDEPMYKALAGSVAGLKMKRSAVPVMEEEKVQEELMDAAPAETIANFVSTIQTSLNTEFAIALPYTVSSSGKPTLVDIRNHEMKADYVYSVVPKLDLDAFLLARLTGWEEFSLLPGEANVFFEGTFVAKTYIDPENIKDTLAVSLGRDKRIVVKREKLKDFSSRKAIGSNQRDSYTYEISVRNTKSESIHILIEDQLPVSQNNQIEVTATDTGASKYSAYNGKMIWDFTIQSNDTKKVQYKFDVKYPKDRTLAALY